MRKLTIIILMLFFAMQGKTQIIKGTGIVYFDSIPSVTPNLLYGSELGFGIKTQLFYRWNRDSSKWYTVPDLFGTGDANYFPSFSDDSTLVNSILYQSGDSLVQVFGGMVIDSVFLLNSADSILVWRNGKVYRRDASTISVDIGGGISALGVVYGSGTEDYSARWLNDSTLTTGAIYDDGSGNVAIGTSTLKGVLNIDGNIGVDAGNDNARFGTNSLNALTSGNYNFAGGRENYRLATNPAHSFGFGFRNFYSIVTGSTANFAQGYQNFYTATAVSRSFAQGWQNFYSSTDGLDNFGVGYRNYYNSSDIERGFAAGYQNFYDFDSGNFNFGAGQENFYSDGTGTGNYNFGQGYRNFYDFTSGDFNFAQGNRNFDALLIGSANFGQGTRNALLTTNGSYNFLQGEEIADGVLRMDNSFMQGYYVLEGGTDTTAYDSFIWGYQAGQNASESDSLIVLGSGAAASNANTNIVAIGHGSSATKDNQINIGSSDYDEVNIDVRTQMVTPIGATAERLASPDSASFRFNTDSLWWEGYNGSEWRRFGWNDSHSLYYSDNFDLGADNVGAALDTIGKKLGTNCFVNNVVVSDGITPRQAYKNIYADPLCPTVVFNNPSGDTGYVYTFERTALVQKEPGKRIVIEGGVVINLDTFPDSGAGDADTAYVDEASGTFTLANGVFSFFEVDNLVFENYGRINASNKVDNVPLGTTAEKRRSTHGIRIDESDNVDVRGGTFQDVWFGVYVVGSDNAFVHDVTAIVGDTASSGPRRFASANDETCCGDFNNAAVTFGQGTSRSRIDNVRAFGYSEVIDLNPVVSDPTMFNVYGENIYEGVVETSGAVGYKVYGVSGKNCTQLLELAPYLGQSSVGTVFGARIEYDSTAPYWLKDKTITEEVIGIVNGFESSVYDASVILAEGVDYVDHAAVYRKAVNPSANVYGPVRGVNTITVVSDSSFFLEDPIELHGGDIRVFFSGSLNDNQSVVDVRQGPVKVDIQQAENNYPSTSNTSILKVSTLSKYPVRYNIAEDTTGFDSGVRVSTHSVLEPIHPVRATTSLITEQDDILYAFYPEAHFRYTESDTAISWRSVVNDKGISVPSGEIPPIFLSETEGLKFSADGVLVNTTFDDDVDFQEHRITVRFKVDTIGAGTKTLFRWGGNDPYRVRFDATTLYFQVSSTGWSNQSAAVTIAEDTWYVVSVIIDDDDLTVRFGEDCDIADVITYTASQALASGTGTFSINARTDGTEGNAKTFSHLIISSGTGSTTTATRDEEAISCNSYDSFTTFTNDPGVDLRPFPGWVYGIDNLAFGWTQAISTTNLSAGDSFEFVLVNSDGNSQEFDVAGVGTGGFIRPSTSGSLTTPATTITFSSASHNLKLVWDGSNFWVYE